MYFSIKIAAMAANLLSPPSYDQVEQFVANHLTPVPVAEVAVAEEDATIADSTLPPWEAADLPDPPLPHEDLTDFIPVPPAIEDAVVAVEPTAETESAEEAEVAQDDSGLVSPLPAYYVDGTDDDDEEYAYEDESYDDSYEDYAAEYTEEYYRELEERFAESTEEAAEHVAEAPVDESFDSEWYEDAAEEDPFGPVADSFEATEEDEEETNEYYSYEELGLVEEMDEATDVEAEATEVSEAAEEAYTEVEDYYAEEYYDEDYFDEDYYASEYEASNEPEVVEGEPVDSVDELTESSEADGYADEYYSDEEYYYDEYEGYDEEPVVDDESEVTAEVSDETVIDESSEEALATIIENWDSITPATRETIMALVNDELIGD